jgi:hypothetical protein
LVGDACRLSRFGTVVVFRIVPLPWRGVSEKLIDKNKANKINDLDFLNAVAHNLIEEGTRKGLRP